MGVWCKWLSISVSKTAGKGSSPLTPAKINKGEIEREELLKSLKLF